MKNKKAVLSLYIVFFILAIVIVTITAVFAPMGVLFNTEMYKAGEDILLQSNKSISEISDTAVKAEVQAVIAEAKSDAQTNIEVNADLFQYGWILLISIVGIVLFIYARQLVEYGGGSLV